MAEAAGSFSDRPDQHRRPDHESSPSATTDGQRARVRGSRARQPRSTPSLFLSAGDNAYLVAAPPLLDRAIYPPLRPLLGRGGARGRARRARLGPERRGGGACRRAAARPPLRRAVRAGAGRRARAPGRRLGGRLRRAAGWGCDGACPVRFVLLHRPIDAGNPIMPLLRQRHVAAILAGHLHRYERHVRAGSPPVHGRNGRRGAWQRRVHPSDAGCDPFAPRLRVPRDPDRRAAIAYRFVDQTGHVRIDTGNVVRGARRLSPR